MGPRITVTAIGQIRPERRQHLLAALPRFAALARRQPGCLTFEYRLAQHALTITEHWADPLVAMQHLAQERTRRFLAFAHACLEAPPGLTVAAMANQSGVLWADQAPRATKRSSQWIV